MPGSVRRRRNAKVSTKANTIGSELFIISFQS
jgi:hypothetical protein